MTRFYSGIGSRACRDNIILLDKLFDIGRSLALEGYVLRSGHADGSDIAFEKGCDDVRGGKEIYLPWKNFNRSDSAYYEVSTAAYELAERVVSHWGTCSDAARRLHARNCFQVLGRNLKTPSDFVVCWTPGGAIVGGTATAIKIARMHNIPVLNLGASEFLGVKPSEIVRILKKRM